MESLKRLDFVGMVIVANNMKEAILGCDFAEIWGCVTAGADITRERASDAVDICKRKFKEEDIVLMVVRDENEKDESGIVFTEKGIYYWSDENGFMTEILYGSIKDMDFNQDSVTIINTDDKWVNIFCGGDLDDNYSRYMYYYIKDLKEAYMQFKGHV